MMISLCISMYFVEKVLFVCLWCPLSVSKTYLNLYSPPCMSIIYKNSIIIGRFWFIWFFLVIYFWLTECYHFMNHFSILYRVLFKYCVSYLRCCNFSKLCLICRRPICHLAVRWFRRNTDTEENAVHRPVHICTPTRPGSRINFKIFEKSKVQSDLCRLLCPSVRKYGLGYVWYDTYDLVALVFLNV